MNQAATRADGPPSAGRRVAWGVALVAALVMLSVGVLLWRAPGAGLPSGQGAQGAGPGLPWEVEVLPEGASRVMGLVLGRSTLQDARELWPQGFRVGVMASSGQGAAHSAPVLEAFSDVVVAGGVVTGKMVLTADAPSETLAGWMARPSRTERTASGLVRYSLQGDDEALAWHYPIRAVTFVPTARVALETLVARFGPTTLLWDQAGDGQTAPKVRFLAYPDRGVVLSSADKGHVVLQYTQPKNVWWMMERLQAPPALLAQRP